MQILRLLIVKYIFKVSQEKKVFTQFSHSFVLQNEMEMQSVKHNNFQRIEHNCMNRFLLKKVRLLLLIRKFERHDFKMPTRN